MERLDFCRTHLHNLNFNELTRVYNILVIEYANEEQILKDKVEYNDLDEVLWFIYKKMNGEAMEIIEEYLEQKGIKNNIEGG